MQLICGSYRYNRPNFSNITDFDFEKGKKECFAILKKIAKNKIAGPNYKALAQKLTIDYPFDSDPRFLILTCMVGELSIESHINKGPLISALVIDKENGMPGNGFFLLAQELGEGLIKDKTIFWANEVRKVYNHKW